jgi:anaphase-promoting complex subunit 3
MSGATAVLREICEQQLTVFLYDSALFLAERLYYQEPSEAHLNLVAQCMLRMGQHKQACMLLEGAKEPANRYLFALACIELGKFAEAEAALFPVKLKPGKAADLSDEDVAKVRCAAGDAVTNV